MIRFQSELAEFCERSAKNRVLRAQLSEKSTVSERQISAIELGEKRPSLNSLELLLRSLGASADQLFYPELSENDPTLAQIVHLAGACNAQQKRMIVAFIQMLQAEEYGENKIATFGGNVATLLYNEMVNVKGRPKGVVP